MSSLNIIESSWSFVSYLNGPKSPAQLGGVGLARHRAVRRGAVPAVVFRAATEAFMCVLHAGVGGSDRGTVRCANLSSRGD